MKPIDAEVRRFVNTDARAPGILWRLRYLLLASGFLLCMINLACQRQPASKREPPMESVRELERYIKAREAEEARLPQPPDTLRSKESPLQLLYARLRFLRERAYPNDRVDWSIYMRALAHRYEMQPANLDRYKDWFLPDFPFWQFVGPNNFETPAGPVTGRVNAVVYDPADDNTFYIGAAIGGVWKTTDRGKNWVPLSNAWPFEAISSIAIDPKNSKILYVGTGDFHGSDKQSFGLMKSTDGGATWTNLGRAEFGETSVSKIVIDPENSDVIVLTCGRGRQGYGQVWRSTDAGKTWKAVITDFAEWAEVAVSHIRVYGDRWYYAVGWTGSEGKVYRSADRGATWTALKTPLSPGEQFGLSIATSPQYEDNVYLLAGKDHKVFYSYDAGNTWGDATADSRHMMQEPWQWDRVWYDWYIRCSTAHQVPGSRPADVLYVGLKGLFQSTSLKSWKHVENGHVDQHDLAIDPREPEQMLIGNDGGVYLVEHEGGVLSLQSLNARLGITQFYKGAFSASDPNVMLGGTQDNGTAVAEGRFNRWKFVNVGDGGSSAISPTNNNVQFTTAAIGAYGVYRTDDRWSTSKNITPPNVPRPPRRGQIEEIPKLTALTMDPNGSGLLWWATNYLYVWNDNSQKWFPLNLSTWNAESRSWDPLHLRGAITTIAVAPRNSFWFYTGSADGTVLMSEFLGADVKIINFRATTVLPHRSVTSISVNPVNQDNILVGLGGSDTGDIGHVWRCDNTTNDAWRNWVDISGSGANRLPDIIVHAIARDPNDPGNVFFVGTDLGVFYTDDGGANWYDVTLPFGLPSVPVYDLVAAGSYLYAVTWGRGIWRAKIGP